MKEIKFLKRILKKRKNVTVSVLVTFLITGVISYSDEILNKTIIENGLNIETNDKSIYNTGRIVNNEGTAIFRYNDKGDSKINFIENRGRILGKNSTNNSILGNGILVDLYPYGHSVSELTELENYGLIQGVAKDGSFSGNGIFVGSKYANQHLSLINSVYNEGIISGSESTNTSHTSGNAILSNFGTSYIKFIKNKGVISGESQRNFSSNGNGIYSSAFSDINSKATIEEIINEGIIKGTTNAINVEAQGGKGSNIGIIKNKGVIQGGKGTKPTSISTGRGIVVENIDKIINDGIISGENYAINNFGTTITEIKNNGVIKSERNDFMTGKGTVTSNGILVGTRNTVGITKQLLGTEILIDSTGNITNIENGLGGEVILEDGTKKVVINGQRYDENNHTTDQANLAKDSYITANGNNYENSIINGAGINKGALVVEAGTSINDSTVNGYNTAVYLENSSQLTATNTIFNGGGLKNDVAVIKGSTGDNVASISGASIINGAVNLQDGNDTLSIANTVQINGELDGGTGNDILNLGETSITKVTPNLNILHNITGFETINTNGNITLFETTKITGADKINLESGNLVLRVDPTITANGKVTGHALYKNNGTLTSNGGNLVVGLNGLGEGTIISMGGTTITPDTDDSWWKDTDHIKTNSLVLDGKLSADGKDINITVLESIPLEPSNPAPIEPPSKPPVEIDPPITPPTEPEPPVNPPINPEAPIVVDSLLYEKLNKVYQSIVTSGEIGSLANTTLLENKTYNESLGGLLTILDQMYANNPYTYTVKSSRDSLKLFEDNMSYLTIKPKKDEMIVQGKAIYTGVKNDSGAYGKNYYGFDTGHRNYKTTTNTVGGLATFEYGLTDKTSVGVVLGGNNQDINFKGSSKIKGNSLYLGTFAKTDINNFKFMGGVGYQYTSADADRKVSNRYDSFSTGDKYDINSLNAFVEAKYIYNAEQDWTVEPKVRLSYYYIDQDKVNEGYTPGQISMKTDKVNSNTADVEIGVDFIKSLYLNTGKLKNILSLGVINTIGDKSKELNGYILGKEKDGKKFDIQGVELPKTSGKVSYNIELEQTNGMIYTAGVSLEFAKDYNRNVSATVGIGYKF